VAWRPGGPGFQQVDGIQYLPGRGIRPSSWPRWRSVAGEKSQHRTYSPSFERCGWLSCADNASSTTMMPRDEWHETVSYGRGCLMSKPIATVATRGTSDRRSRFETEGRHTVGWVAPCGWERP
jgi:hypothetical protein